MNNPFVIKEPTCISFSGGRTSAFMLYKTIEANNGKIPEDSIVCFANTGKEDEATLQFVKNCETRWETKIIWLEYTSAKPGFKVVNFETASRNGEPFEEMISYKKALPNNFMRFCTSELKVKLLHKYIKHNNLGIEEDSHWVGIRADEPRRIAKVGISMCPLAAAGITSAHIKQFWESSLFDLYLPPIGQNKLSNCDLCFMKGDASLVSLILDKPERADWWIAMEEKAKKESASENKNVITFRRNAISYQEIKTFSEAQLDMFSDNAMACFCGD